MDSEIDINEMLKHLKDMISTQAVEIAILKAQLEKAKDS